MTFLSAPPSSTPLTSRLEYTRKRGVAKTACASRAVASSVAAATTAVGCPWQTSAAKLGPLSTAKRACGRHSANTCDMSASDSASMPLVALTTSVPSRTAPASGVATARTAWLGGAETTTSAPLTASRGVAGGPERRARARTPARKSGFSCVRLIASATSGSKAQSRTSSPLHASRLARVVPQLPAPSTATRVTGARAEPRAGRTGSRSRGAGA